MNPANRFCEPLRASISTRSRCESLPSRDGARVEVRLLAQRHHPVPLPRADIVTREFISIRKNRIKKSRGISDAAITHFVAVWKTERLMDGRDG